MVFQDPQPDGPRSDRAQPDFQALFEHAPGLFLVLLPDLTIVAASDAYLAATMTRRRDILGRGIFEVFPDNPDDSQATGESNLGASLDRVRTALVTDTMALQKYDIRRPDAEGGAFEERFWSPVNSPVIGADGALRYIIHRVEDVTEFVVLRAQENEQQRVTDELRTQVSRSEAELLARAREIAETNRQLERANAELRQSQDLLRTARETADRANLAKSEFLSRMSHELRTPLNAVLGFSQLLEMDDLTADQRDNVGHILAAGRHLLGLINDVLDITRIEAGQLTISPEPVAVHDLVVELAALLRPMATARSVTILVPDDDRGHSVLADRQRLKQVLLNLMTNALKYNREGGLITVRSEPAPNDRLRISVVDTGFGIPPDSLDRLFQPFERLGAEYGSVEGTGVGLALSKVLVEALGGSIGAESVLDIGSTFWIELDRAEDPIGRYERSLRTPGRAVEEPAIPRLVLYIEDNLSNQRLVERIIERRPGFRLVTALGGAEGIELARHHRPDIVLLDLHLGDLPGHEVLRLLTSYPETRSIPVLIVSADATERRAARLIAAGASAYLTKPIDVQELLTAIDRALAGT